MLQAMLQASSLTSRLCVVALRCRRISLIQLHLLMSVLISANDGRVVTAVYLGSSRNKLVVAPKEIKWTALAVSSLFTFLMIMERVCFFYIAVGSSGFESTIVILVTWWIVRGKGNWFDGYSAAQMLSPWPLDCMCR